MLLCNFSSSVNDLWGFEGFFYKTIIYLYRESVRYVLLFGVEECCWGKILIELECTSNLSGFNMYENSTETKLLLSRGIISAGGHAFAELFLHSALHSTEWAMEQENLFTQISFFLIIYDNFVLNFNIHYFAFYDYNGSCPYHVNDAIVC